MLEDTQALTNKAEAVDVTLIRWMVSLTPAERLAVLQQFVNSVLAIRARNAAR
jgi:hypothetical protein